MNENEDEGTDEYDSGEEERNELDMVLDDGNDDEDGLANTSITTNDEEQLEQIYENILDQRHANDTVALLVTKSKCI